MRIIARLAAGFVARVMIVLLASGAAVPLVVHGTGDDPCDAPSPWSATTVVARQAQVPTPAGHCEICHFLRLLPGLDAVAVPVRTRACRSRWSPTHHSPRRAIAWRLRAFRLAHLRPDPSAILG